jgi:hypothetical protein
VLDKLLVGCHYQGRRISIRAAYNAGRLNGEEEAKEAQVE